MTTQTTRRVKSLRGVSRATDEHAAVTELRNQIDQSDQDVVLFFCSPTYDLVRLGDELRGAFDCAIVGCTTAGELGPDGFSKLGITAVSISGVDVQAFAIDLVDVESNVSEVAVKVVEHLAARAEASAFGLLLVDGLSKLEERVSSSLYQQLPMVPIVGGSAGDNLSFQRTHVFVDGAFRTGAAVFALFTLTSPFTTLKFQHFVPSADLMVVTDADPDQRVIREIDGEPAAVVYARKLGLSLEQLDAVVFSNNPIVVNIGGEHYVRSIAQRNPDNSLSMFCAIEDGVVISLGCAVDACQAAEAAFQRVREQIGEPELIIGCDCILRRLEFESKGLVDAIGGIHSANNVIGFSTYGEQFNGIHVNQTFTGIAIGK